MKNKLIIKTGIIISVIVLLSSLTSCAREISSNVYDAYAIGESCKTFTGVIVHTRDVKVSNADSLEQNGIGIATAGLGGALVGSQFGRGTGQVATTILGATAGAVGGAFAEKALKEQIGIEYIIQLDNGEARTIVQGPNPRLSVGQHVYLIESEKGRSRIIAK